MRQRYEGSVSILQEEAKALEGRGDNLPLIIIDEVQNIPAIIDVVQLLMDEGIAQFVLIGSSARKLKRGNEINLLLGKFVLRLDPLSTTELNKPLSKTHNLLLYGSLPEIMPDETNEQKEEDLFSI